MQKGGFRIDDLAHFVVFALINVTLQEILIMAVFVFTIITCTFTYFCPVKPNFVL